MKRKPIKTALRVFLGMIFVVLIITVAIFAYVFFVRRDRTINKVVSTDTINDDTISKAEAERRNLDNVVQTPIEINNLKKDTNVTISQDTSISTGLVIGNAYEVTKDLTLNKQQILESYKAKTNFAPVFFFKLDALSINVDVNALSSLIMSEVNSNNYRIIYLDTTFTYVKDFNVLLLNLKTALAAKSIKLGLYVYPKWGNEVDYNDFLQIANNYFTDNKLADIQKMVDEVVIQLYGYSNEYSILPANIAPVNWAKAVVAFTTLQTTDKSNVYFEINSNSYIWPEREFVTNTKDNYSVLDPQAEVLNKLQFTAKNYSEINSNDLGDTYETMKTLEIGGKRFISVSPKQENIDKLIAIVASYGFPGVIIK